MKKCLFVVFSFLLMMSARAADKDSTVNYNLPDSVKAVQFMAEINVKSADFKKKYFSCGISAYYVKVYLNSAKKQKKIIFRCHHLSKIVTKGYNVNSDFENTLMFPYDWKTNTDYKLLISLATDSAENFSLYSGYVFLPKENKWKLIGTCKIERLWSTLQSPASFQPAKNIDMSIGQVWVQRNNGSWKNMKSETLPNPTINLFRHVDSVKQRQTDIKLIEDAIASGKTDVKDIAEGVYYKMMKEGTGKQVSINDTVTVLYRLTLLNDGSLVTETKEKPDTFSLKRLIRGWQIGVPLCKVGGKIKLVIPSDLAYSIRTRAARIPPNSILVFEIEVLGAKSQQ